MHRKFTKFWAFLKFDCLFQFYKFGPNFQQTNKIPLLSFLLFFRYFFSLRKRKQRRRRRRKWSASHFPSRPRSCLRTLGPPRLPLRRSRVVILFLFLSDPASFTVYDDDASLALLALALSILLCLLCRIRRRCLSADAAEVTAAPQYRSEGFLVASLSAP